jgi:hypothetical protein
MRLRTQPADDAPEDTCPPPGSLHHTAVAADDAAVAGRDSISGGEHKRADVSKKDDSKKETAKPKASSSGGEHPTGEHPTEAAAKRKRKRKRQDAKRARVSLRSARFYATRPKHSLSRVQKRLVDRQDELLNMCIKKNKAYGYGTGATEPITQHDAIFHRMACQGMGKYCQTVEPKAPTSGGEHPTDGAPKRKRTDTPAHEHESAKHPKFWFELG